MAGQGIRGQVQPVSASSTDQARKGGGRAGQGIQTTNLEDRSKIMGKVQQCQHRQPTKLRREGAGQGIIGQVQLNVSIVNRPSSEGRGPVN